MRNVIDTSWHLNRGSVVSDKYLTGTTLSRFTYHVFMMLFSLIIYHVSLTTPSAHALSFTSASLSNTVIPFETSGIPTGTTVQFTLDNPANVTVTVTITPAGTTTPVATLSATGASGNAFWNGLWLIGAALGRQDGNFTVSLSATDGTNSASTTIGTLLSITSVDIHNLSVATGFDSSGLTAPPYAISYQLAHDSLVTITITNSSTGFSRTLISKQPQPGEVTQSSNTVTWDGLDTNGVPIPPGIYTATVNAKDPSSADTAIARTITIPAQSPINSNTNVVQVFDQNVFVYPNPVRSAPATFQFEALRPAAVITLKIYTIAGDLVRSERFSNLTVGTITHFTWDLTNASGRSVGRGLYFYVVREDDSQGTLQTVKKMAVIK